MLDEVNSYRKLLQMPLLRSIESSLLTLSKTAASTTAHPSIDIAPSKPEKPSKITLESMPPEILDRIVSFVRGDDILRWCHAVPYFKYISKAMYDFGYPIRTRYRRGTVHFNFWPCVNLRQPRHTPYEAILPVPLSHLHALQKYSAVLSKHSGYASIDDSTGITVLGAIPENIEVWVHHAKLFLGTDKFFGALYNAKKNIRELLLDATRTLNITCMYNVFENATSSNATTRDHWQLLRHPNLKDAGVALSECKSLRKLSISNVFEGEESPEVLVQKVIDIIEPTKIRELAIYQPWGWQSILRDDLRALGLSLELQTYTLLDAAKTIDITRMCNVSENVLRLVSTYDQDTSTTVNSIRRLPQMPPLEIIGSSFLTQPVSTAPCLSTDTVLSKPATAVIPTLESMPPEILDLIASFVDSFSILRLCHAVRYYKYISQAMFDIGYPLTLQKSSKFTYSNILSKHGGYASIDSTSMTMVGALPKNMEVEVGCATPSPATDKFFGALHNAKKNIWQLSLGFRYFARCESDPDLLVVTAKWLVKLRIHELHFLSSSGIPTEICGMLHLMPMLKSLHLQNLGDCAGIAFSEFKMLKKLMISDLFAGEENPEELVQQVVNVLQPTKIQQVMKPKCPCCQRHKLVQQRMLDEVNSLRRLLQMPSFESVCSSFLSTPVSTALCSSIDNAPSRPAPESEPLRPTVESVPSKPALASKPSKTSLGSMPPEILDRIVLSVSGHDILQLCHAVQYFKYISAAMYAFGHRPKAYKVLSPSDFWPHLDVRSFLGSTSNPRLHGLGTYSRILSKHGGCARISYHRQIVAVLDHLPESVQVRVEEKCSSQDMDDLFAVLYRAKKVINKLRLSKNYFKHFVPDAATLKMMANWFVKLPINELHMHSKFSIPTPLLRLLHLAPSLVSLHLTTLKDCAGVALSECKSLRKLSFSKLFDGTESPEELIQQVLDILNPAKIQQLEWKADWVYPAGSQQ
ncbi:hypothetical protein HDU77_011040 [Chytriomyces hyalinus]|nr:hypothetical protein HDU77_011040 [Chytriomyces hyalinus]